MKMTAQDIKWRAEEDLRTLARAKEIEADKQRHIAAKTEATTKIKELQKVVSKPTKPAPKPTQSKPVPKTMPSKGRK